MWKYLLGGFFLLIGALEILLALNAPLREAVLQASLVRAKRAEPAVLLLVGCSALVTGLGLILYGAFW
jgi:hypothetical protein